HLRKKDPSNMFRAPRWPKPPDSGPAGLCVPIDKSSLALECSQKRSNLTKRVRRSHARANRRREVPSVRTEENPLVIRCVEKRFLPHAIAHQNELAIARIP